MRIFRKIKQTFEIVRTSKRPIPLLLDMLRLKRSNYIANCKCQNFFVEAGCHEWYTLIENVVREDYIRGRINISPGDTVIDIGANFGSFTAVASSKVGPTGQVVSFEPNPSVFERLVRNVRLNGLSNVQTHGEAVGGETGSLTLYMQKRSSLTTAFERVDRYESNHSSECTVRKRSINDIIDAVGGVDLLKVDCEGGEYEIFARLDVQRARKVRQISMEVHDIPGRKRSEITERLIEFGFDVTSGLSLVRAVRPDLRSRPRGAVGVLQSVYQTNAFTVLGLSP